MMQILPRYPYPRSVLPSTEDRLQDNEPTPYMAAVLRCIALCEKKLRKLNRRDVHLRKFIGIAQTLKILRANLD